MESKYYCQALNHRPLVFELSVLPTTALLLKINLKFSDSKSISYTYVQTFLFQKQFSILGIIYIFNSSSSKCFLYQILKLQRHKKINQRLY